MNITNVRVRHANRSIWGHLAEREKTLPLVTPLDIYTDFKTTRGSWFWDSGMAAIEVETDAGHTGVGWCEDGCCVVDRVVNTHLKRLLIGHDARDIEGLWDRLFRATLPYGRKGIALQAISAIDIALWDLAGKASGKPVYQLLGGRARHSIPVYASALHPVEPNKVRAEAQQYLADGFTAMKMRFPFGPGDGLQGMRANEDHVAHVRDTVGPDILLAADAYMGWDFVYAKQMCNRLEKYDLAWIEEPFIPDDLASYTRLRKETSIPISGGEHEYTRYGFQEIIEREAMDIIQPDLRRCGGFTEGRRIAALIASAGLTLIPHAYGITHLHYAIATPGVPMAEYFPLPCWDALPTSDIEPIFLDEPEPVRGEVKLSEKPGLGVEVNEKIFD